MTTWRCSIQRIWQVAGVLLPEFTKPCGGAFTIEALSVFSYCKWGACYSRTYTTGTFPGGTFQLENSRTLGEWSSVGIGSQAFGWSVRTSDGGVVSGSKTQEIPLTTNPVNNTIHFTKTLNGNIIWEKDIDVEGGGIELVEIAGELAMIQQNNGDLVLTNINCLEDNPPPPPGEGVDLELSMTTSNASPDIYSSVEVTLTINNTGNEPATGVVVGFPKPDGTVYTGGNEWSATQGTFIPFGEERWTVGDIEAGGSASLTVSYFLLTGNTLTPYAQVIGVNETDSDSAPGNGTCCTPNEDDEASIVLNDGVGNNLATLVPSGRPIILQAVYPSPVYFGEITVVIFSELEGTFDLEIYDLLGRKAISRKIELEEGRNKIPMEVYELESGTYYLNMPGQNWRNMPLRFVVARW